MPAAIYATLNWYDTQALRGWAVPAATDVAFAIGICALLGLAVPTSLKMFLLALAIIDDLMAIVVIAIFYTEDLSALALVLGSCQQIAVPGQTRARLHVQLTDGCYFRSSTSTARIVGK